MRPNNHNSDGPNAERKYSICITHYNNVDTVRSSLESILSQINENFEVVAVDNCSTDGSFEILSEYARTSKVKLMRFKSSRGKGRQLAFENSQGEYVIANLDMDETYRRGILDLLNYYHNNCEGDLLLVVAATDKKRRGLQNITIGPRTLISGLGGWRDLQYSEDWDLWSRAAKIGRFCLTTCDLLLSPNMHPEREALVKKLKFRYVRYCDSMRLGRVQYYERGKMSFSQKMIYLLARLSLPFYESYQDEFNLHFTPYDPKYFRPWVSPGSGDRPQIQMGFDSS